MRANNHHHDEQRRICHEAVLVELCTEGLSEDFGKCSKYYRTDYATRYGAKASEDNNGYKIKGADKVEAADQNCLLVVCKQCSTHSSKERTDNECIDFSTGCIDTNSLSRNFILTNS